jgi:hypothetical protein
MSTEEARREFAQAKALDQTGRAHGQFGLTELTEIC